MAEENLTLKVYKPTFLRLSLHSLETQNLNLSGKKPSQVRIYTPLKHLHLLVKSCFSLATHTSFPPGKVIEKQHDQGY